MATVRNDGSRARLRAAILVVTMFVLLTPLVSAAVFGFSLPGQGFTLAPLNGALQDATFMPQLSLSLQLAVLSTIGSLLLVLPTLIWLHIKAPRILGFTESVSIFPLVVPAVALVSGANLVFRPLAPSFLVSPYSLVPFYIILALPLVYRTLDAGVRALDVTVLMEAGASLGAGWWRCLFGLVAPNMGTAVLNASLLTFTMSFGEYALASLLLQATLPVFMVQIGTTNAHAAAALSFLISLGTWVLLYLVTAGGGRAGRAPGRRPRLDLSAQSRAAESSGR